MAQGQTTPNRILWRMDHSRDISLNHAPNLSSGTGCQLPSTGNLSVICPVYTARWPASWTIWHGRHQMLEVYVIEKDRLWGLWRATEEKLQHHFLEFWSKTMPSALEKWTALKMQFCSWTLVEMELFITRHQVTMQPKYPRVGTRHRSSPPWHPLLSFPPKQRHSRESRELLKLLQNMESQKAQVAGSDARDGTWSLLVETTWVCLFY